MAEAPDATDQSIVDSMESSVFLLQQRYWSTQSALERAELEPQIEMALEKITMAKIRLLKQGTLSSDGDLEAIQQIQTEIEEAADRQSYIVAAVRLVAYAGRFVV